MKAALLENRNEGGFGIRDIDDPVPTTGNAIMRVRASSLNRVDIYLRDNGFGITHVLPLILGVDGVGEIIDCQPESGLRSGDRVALYSSSFCGTCRYCLAGEQPLCLNVDIAGEHRHGSFAEYISMPSRCFIPLPDNISFQDAGVLPAAYGTAYRMLFGKSALQPGETLLIVGAGGGVAVACIQLAMLAGARVFVTSSTDEKIAKALNLGAEGGVNYRTGRVAKEILEMTGGEGVDMVIDSVGEASWGESLRSLRRGGRIVTCGATTGSNPPVEIQRMFIRQLQLYGSTGANMNEMRQLFSLVATGRLQPVIDSIFPLENISQAFDQLAGGQQFGKVAVSID